jgi:HPt (histidine-containing phosphotransfer) domain-containing protein
VHLIPAFLERREKEVSELTQLLAGNRFDDIKLIGHRLKGMGAGYGFPLVSEIGRELEAAAGSADTSHIHRSIAQLASFATSLKILLTLKTDD